VKRVLIIAYMFPPIHDSGTQRPLKFSNYLPDFGWEPTVLTVKSPPDINIDPALLSEIRSGTNVIRVKLLSDVVAEKFARVFPFQVRKRIHNGLAWRLRAIWNLPDFYASWRPTAVRAGRKIFNEKPFHAIYATGYPWTSLLVGRDIAEATNTPLISDFRDPWTDDYVFSISKKPRVIKDNNNELKQSVLSTSAAIVTVSESLSSLMRHEIGCAINAPIVTIENGYDPHDFLQIDKITIPKNKKRVVYAGVWKEKYNPGLLYKAISLLKNENPQELSALEFITAGYEPGFADSFQISHFVEERGLMSHNEALRLISSGDLLFLQVADGIYSRMHLPGKVFEYAATNIPILASAPQDSQLAKFLDILGSSVVVQPDNILSVKNILLSLAKNKSLNLSRRDPNVLKQYTRMALTKKLACLLDNVC